MNSDTVWEQFVRMAQAPDGEVDLARAALLIVASEYPTLDIEHQLGLLDSLAAGVAARLGEERDPLFCINTLSQYLFDEIQLRGNQEDYYDPRNSYLNEVLHRRLGIPITLSLIYMEVGKRLDVPLVGIGMPGHFLVRHRAEEDLFIDPFYGGILLSVEECAQRLQQVTGTTQWDPRYLAPIGNGEFLARILRNLKGVYLQRADLARALRTMNWLITFQPQALHELRDRGLLHYQLGQYQQALDDLQSYLASATSRADTDEIQRLVDLLLRMLAH